MAKAAGAGAAASVLPAGPVTDGPVEAFARIGRRLYVGGQFGYVGADTGSGVMVDPQRGGLLEGGGPRFDGPVSVAIPDGSGGLYVAGSFTHVDLLPADGLIHLQADGSPDPGFRPPSIPGITALAVSRGQLYVGGLAPGDKGSWTPVVRSLDAATGALDPAFSVRLKSAPLPEPPQPARPPLPGAAPCENDAPLLRERPPELYGVSALLVSGSRVFVGGQFETVNGVARIGLAAVDASTGVVESGFGPKRAPALAQGIVTALALVGGRLYAAGDLVAGSNYLRGVAAFDPQSGALDPGFVVHDPANTAAMAVDGGRLYLAGETASGQPTIVAVDAASGRQLVHLALDDYPTTMAVDGRTLYVGTQFTHRAADYLRAYALASGRLLASFDPRVDDVVHAITPWGAGLFVGGQFASAGGERTSGVAALDARTGAIDPRFQSTGWLDVRGLAASRRGLYVSGVLAPHARSRPDSAPYLLHHGVVGAIKLDVRTGRRDANFKPSGDRVDGRSFGDGPSIALEGSRVYVFDVRAGLVALDSRTGRRVRGFSPAFPDGGGFVATPSEIYTTTASGTGIVAMNTPTGAADRRFKPELRFDSNDDPISLALGDHLLYASGGFLPLGRRQYSRVIALRLPSGDRAPRFHPPSVDSAVLSAFGSLLLVSLEDHLYDALFDSNTGGSVRLPATDPYGNVCVGQRAGGLIYLGGDFSGLGGDQSRSNLAVIDGWRRP